jgi:hypothetical protein
VQLLICWGAVGCWKAVAHGRNGLKWALPGLRTRVPSNAHADSYLLLLCIIQVHCLLV